MIHYDGCISKPCKLEPWCTVDLKRRWVQKSRDHVLGHLRHDVVEPINWQRPTPGNRASRKNSTFAARCLKEYHVGAHKLVCKASDR